MFQRLKLVFFTVLLILPNISAFSNDSVSSEDKKSRPSVPVTNQQKLINEHTVATISTDAKQAIVMDFHTGAILFEKNAFSKMVPSSMTKIMLMYVSFQAIKDRKISLDTKAEISEKAWKMPGSKMFLEVGKEVGLEDLICGIIVQSGNDACIVISDKLFGSDELCAQHMVDTASKIGMTSSHFKNTHGWPDEDHFSSAYDLALLACRIIKDFPEYYHYFSKKEFTYSNIHQYNRNSLLWDNIGVDGLKTGSTAAGGYGLVASALRDGRRIIVVVNGCKSPKHREEEAKKLFGYGYSQFTNYVFADQKESSGPIKVIMGKKRTVNVVADGGMSAITVPNNLLKGIRVSSILGDRILGNDVKAPIKKGQRVSTLKVEFKDDPCLKFEIPLVAVEDIEELNIWEKFVRAITELLEEFISRAWTTKW